jgi:hypothetical protein
VRSGARSCVDSMTPELLTSFHVFLPSSAALHGAAHSPVRYTTVLWLLRQVPSASEAGIHTPTPFPRPARNARA